MYVTDYTKKTSVAQQESVQDMSITSNVTMYNSKFIYNLTQASFFYCLGIIIVYANALLLTRHKESHLPAFLRAILRAHIHSCVSPCHILQMQNARGVGSVLCSENWYILVSFVMPGDRRPAGTHDGDGGISSQNYLFCVGV